MNIRSEIIEALTTKPRALVNNSSFRFSSGLAELRRHGSELLVPFESVQIAGLSIAGTSEVISERIIRSNYRRLMTDYMELADDHSYDVVPFLKSLPNDMFDHAISAVRHIWGTNNRTRRSTIERSLFDYLQNRVTDVKLAGRLRRYVDIQYLTFDKSNPGYTHPPRQQNPANEICCEEKSVDPFESAG